jgi:hypothetical protein
MASPNEPPNQDALARRALTFEGRKRFQDYVIAFEWFRTLDDKSRRGEAVEEDLAIAAVSLELAHNTWRDFVIGGVRQAPSWYRPRGD